MVKTEYMIREKMAGKASSTYHLTFYKNGLLTPAIWDSSKTGSYSRILHLSILPALCTSVLHACNYAHDTLGLALLVYLYPFSKRNSGLKRLCNLPEVSY